jgi:tripartite ATP-independent transporter DctM subunit
VLPGILLTTIYCLGIWGMVRWRPTLAGHMGPKAGFNLGEIGRAVAKPWQFIIIIIITMGGIYTGWFTPTEAGAIGAFTTFLICFLRRKITPHSLWKIMLDAGYTMAGLYFLFICATMYSRMLAISGVGDSAVQLVVSNQLPPFMVITLMIIVYLLLGCIIDSISIMILTIPIFHPVVQSMGFDPFWFAVVSVIAIEMGLVTPPFGMVVFTMKATLGDAVTVEEIFQGAVPWIIMMTIALIMICLFPSLSTFLPHKMAG